MIYKFYEMLEFMNINNKTMSIFKIYMDMDNVIFNDGVSKQSIKKALIFLTNENTRGNYCEFFTLRNEVTGDFVKTVLENNGYHVEVRYLSCDGGKVTYAKSIFNYEEVLDIFYDFFDGKYIDVTGYEDISYYLK